MKRKLVIPLLLSVPLFANWLGGFDSRSPGASARKARVAAGEMVVSSLYDGKLDTSRAVIIMSRFQGNATIIELAPDGARVAKGDVLVRFDSSALEREVLRLERDHALAQSGLESLSHATLPLALRELDNKLTKARTSLSADQRYLDAITPFAKEDVVSDQEIRQQRLKVEELRASVAALEQEVALTKNYLHPAAVKQAGAKLFSAEQELRLAREQLQNVVVRAPMDGVVVHKSISVGPEFRTVRVGDTVFPNQPFMVLPDMRELLVHCDVPEAELSRVRKGEDAIIQPLAFPELRLRGTVETVGSVALGLPGQPDWQKYFHVVIGLRDSDARLNPGMSVTAQIVSYRRPNAVLAPRAAIRWDEGKPLAKVWVGSSQETRVLRLGMVNEQHYEVLEGLRAGDDVLIGE